MYLAILGLGDFGSSLALSMTNMGHKVMALDRSRWAVEAVAEKVSQALVADVTDREALQEMGVDLVEAAVVCMSEPLGASIMTTLHLKEMGIKWVAAKARHPEQERILKKIGADQVIFPERDSAERLALSLSDPNLLDYLPLGADYSVAEIEPPGWMNGKSLVDLDMRRKHGINVIAVHHREPDDISLLLSPDYVVSANDVLVVVGRREDLVKLKEE